MVILFFSIRVTLFVRILKGKTAFYPAHKKTSSPSECVGFEANVCLFVVGRYRRSLQHISSAHEPRVKCFVYLVLFCLTER